MNKGIRMTRDIIYVLMCVFMVLLLYLYLSEIFLASDQRNPKCIIYIVTVCLADYIFRKYITNAILFFFLRLLFLPAIVVCTTNAIEIILLIIIFLVFYTMGITFWKSEVSDKHLFAIDMPIEGIVLFIGIYLHAALDMSSGLAAYAYISGITYILFHFFKSYLDKFIQISLNLGDNSSSLTPSFRMNSVFVLLFTLSVILFIFVLNILFHDDSFNFIGSFLKYIASIIFGFFLRFKGETVVQEPESATSPSGQGGTTLEVPADNFVHEPTSNPIMNMLFNIFQVVLYIGIVIAILFFLYKFFKTYMYRNRENDDIIETIASDEKNRHKTVSVKTRNKIFLNNREKIRKIYRSVISDKLKHNSRIKIRQSNTPEEIHREIAKKSDCSSTDFKTLTVIYEKARYSNHDITPEDVKSAKSIKPG